MTQEDKELLLKDLAARLPYGVIVNYKENEYDHRKWKITTLHTLSYDKSGTLIDTDYDGWISYEEYEGCGMSTGSRPFKIGDVKPYLRPMSSMTEKEENEFKKIFELELKAIESPEGHTIESAASSAFTIDFYNKYHFDYRGLIEMGLAIEVTKENNPYKE